MTPFHVFVAVVLVLLFAVFAVVSRSVNGTTGPATDKILTVPTGPSPKSIMGLPTEVGRKPATFLCWYGDIEPDPESGARRRILRVVMRRPTAVAFDELFVAGGPIEVVRRDGETVVLGSGVDVALTPTVHADRSLVTVRLTDVTFIKIDTPLRRRVLGLRS